MYNHQNHICHVRGILLWRVSSMISAILLIKDQALPQLQALCVTSFTRENVLDLGAQCLLAVYMEA